MCNPQCADAVLPGNLGAVTPKCEAELLGGCSAIFSFFTWDLKLNKKKEQFSFSSIWGFFANNLLTLKQESCSLLGSLVAARSLSAGPQKGEFEGGLGCCFVVGPLHRPVNRACHISGTSQCQSEQLSSKKWIIQMTTLSVI